MDSPVIGHFIEGGLFENDDYVPSVFRIDQIKSIHMNIAHPKNCTIYTYKDVRYSVYMGELTFWELVKEITDYLTQNGLKPHGQASTTESDR